MQESSDKIWLIKSAGEIKGPYTFDEVVTGLQTKEFIVVDEISKKFSRWKYLREEEEFSQVIIELKNREESRGEKTHTLSQTDTLTEDFTSQVVSFTATSKLTETIEEQLKQNEVKNNLDGQEEKTENSTKVKKFVSEKEIKRKSSQKYLIQLILIVILIGVIAVYFLRKNQEPSWSFEDLKQQAIVKSNYGEFDRAKYYIEKALTLNNQDVNLNYLYAYSELQLDDTASAEKILTALQGEALNPDIKMRADNLLGVIQLKNFNSKQAQDYFQKAIDINPQFVQAIYNRGVTYYLENDFDKSLNDFEMAIQKNGLDGIVLLSLADNLVHNLQDSLQDEDAKNKLTDLIKQMQVVINHNPNYKQELMIAVSYLNFNLGSLDEMNKWVAQALMVDPDQSANHIQDASYYRGLMTWDRIADWVLKMRDANPNSADLKTLYGFAQFKGSEKLKGKDTLEGLLRSDYVNISNQILHAYTLLSLNRDADAMAALEPIMSDAKQVLNFYFMGEICFKQNDLDCAQKNFEQTLKNDPKFEGALAGLAKIYIDKKDYAKAKQTISQGMIISPTYKPLLILKEQLEGKLQ